MAQLGARLDGIEEVVGSNPIGSTNLSLCTLYLSALEAGTLDQGDFAVEMGLLFSVKP